MEINDIAVIDKQENEIESSELYKKAQMYVQSKMLPTWIKTPERYMTLVAFAKDLGFSITTALNSMYIMNDTPTLTGKGMAALIRNRRGIYRLLKEFEPILDDKGKPVDYECVIEAKRPDETWTHTIRTTWNEMVTMGVTSKDNWKKQPKTMLYWRCISKMGRQVFPDFISGLYTAEELDNSGRISFDEDGNLIENFG